MTITVDHRQKKTITASVDGIEIYADIIEGDRTLTVRGRQPGTEFKIDYGVGLDTLIELLHAVKSESEKGATAARRLVEAVEPHEEIIAVTEPTA